MNKQFYSATSKSVLSTLTMFVIFIMFLGLSNIAIAEEKSHLHKDVENLIDVWLSAQLEYENIPSLSASYVKGNKLVWSGVYGSANKETNQLATPNTISSICSTSKVFTATAIMKLVDEGKLNLEQNVSELLPNFNIQQTFPQSAPISVRSLLNHRSGLPRDTEHSYWSGPEHNFPSTKEFYKSVNGMKTEAPVGERESYSNIGYALLGQIIETVTGRTYKNYMEEEIFSVIGMDNSIVELPLEQYGTSHAVGYTAPNRQGLRTRASTYQTQSMQSAAGISSNAIDLAKFARWQFTELNSESSILMSGSSLKQMYQKEEGFNRGKGYIVRQDKQKNTWAMHGGICPGYTSFIKMNVTTQQAYSFTFSANKIRAISYINKLSQIIARAENIHAQPEVNVDLSPYVGFYDLSPWNSEYYVGKWGNDLVLLYLPVDSIQYAMYHYRHVGDDTFQLLENGELGNETLIFNRDVNGKVVSVKNDTNLHYKIKRDSNEQ